jgi:hypothetical protein
MFDRPTDNNRFPCRGGHWHATSNSAVACDEMDHWRRFNQAAEKQVAVNSLDDFRKKYGIEGANMLIGEYIKNAPHFPGRNELAARIGILVADLEAVLRFDRR